MSFKTLNARVQQVRNYSNAIIRLLIITGQWLGILSVIQTYMIGHYNPSVRIIDLVFQMLSLYRVQTSTFIAPLLNSIFHIKFQLIIAQ